MNKVQLVLVLLFVGGFWGKAKGQPNHTGMPYFEVFTPAEYPGEQQNRWISQWDDGSMLIGNSGGMLQHSDQNWRVFGADDITFISALKRSQIDVSKVWAGSFSNIGYFERKDSALFAYQSLTSLLPDTLRDFSNITTIQEFSGKVFFLNDLYLFQYNPETQEIGIAEAVYELIDSKEVNIAHISVWQNALFVFLNNGEILKLNENQEAKSITVQSDQAYSRITASAEWGQYLLLSDADHGLILYDELSMQGFSSSVNDYLAEHTPSHIATFNNGNIAVSTDDGGTVVIDQQGNLQYLLSTKTGLQEDIHNSLYIDHNQDLWISGNESISKIYTGVPVRQLSGETFGFGDAVQVTHFEDQFYVGSIDGLYIQENPYQEVLDASTQNIFREISSTASPFWDFEVVDSTLWTGSNSGIYQVEEDELTLLFDIETYFLRPFGEDKILVVTSNGVELLSKKNGNWTHEGALDVAAFYVYALVVTNQHTFWAGGVQGQLVKVTYNPESNQFIQKKYGEEDGLLPSDAYEPTLQNGQLIINSNSGFMKYDVQSDRLVPFEELNTELGGWGEYLAVDEAGNYWVNYITNEYRGINQLEKIARDEWQKRYTEFEISPDHFGDFIEINGSDLWVGSTQSVMHRNLSMSFDRSAPEVYIWQVQSLFDQEVLSLSGKLEEIPYDQRDIGITLASTSYRFPEKNEFRYKIDDGEWSGWRTEPEVSVNKSLPGTYSLTVQTKNFVQEVSEPVSYAITITAPWYLSKLAYGLYLFLLIGGIGFAVRALSNYRVRREMEQLKLEEAEKLFELDAMKDRLFANISHEFRTPLTISHGLVKKALQKLSDEKEAEIEKRDLLVMNRNMIRLKDMVDQIIDLTKSDQDHLKLKQKYYPAEKLASLSVESFRSLAEFHGHYFEFIDETEDAVLFADRSKVEIMINNLISNAIKFTPNGGKIVIKAEVVDNEFKLTVSDTGPGIPVGDEEAIFERFHRIERSEEEYVEGMGVGLELSRTLARLHGGDIEAKTGVAQGSSFVLTLPIAETDETTPVVELEEFKQEHPAPKDQIAEQNKLARLERTTRQILLVEDNADMRSYVEGILSDLGEVTTASNGKEALDIIGNLRPDLIITDLMMPKMDGKSLIEKLAAHDQWKEIPVVVLSAKALEQDKTELLRIGVVDYITKPFEPEQLMLKSRNLLTYYQRRMNAIAEKPGEEEDESLTKQLISYIRDHISDSTLTVDMLVGQFPQSRRSLYRNIQKETGMTPSELIREVRLTTARNLANKVTKPYRLEELADAVGYKSATSFRRAYEKRFGVHPLE